MRKAGIGWIILSAAAPLSLTAQSSLFADKLYPAFEKAQCRFCHNDNGVGSATRVQFPPEKASAHQIASFGIHLRALVDAAHPEQSLLLQKPTNRVPHTGGERIKQGSEEERTLRAWVSHLATLPASVAVREEREAG